MHDKSYQNFKEYQEQKWLDYNPETDDELLFDWNEEEAEG